MRIVICDSHRIFADTLGMVLKNDGRQVVACTFTHQEGSAAVMMHKPHLCITELDFPEGDGAEAIATAHASSPTTRIVVLSGSRSLGAAQRAKQAGATAFLSKRRALSDILSKLNDVGAGTGAVFDGITNGNANANGNGNGNGRSDGKGEYAATSPKDALCFLTAREREVLERLVQGQDTATLAREMGVRYSTTRTHIQNLLCKLGVHSKLEAVALATTLLPPPATWSEPRAMSNAG